MTILFDNDNSRRRQRLSRLQRAILVELARHMPGKVLTRDIEKALQIRASARIYSSNVRKAFHLMQEKGLVRLYRGADLQLSAMLTPEGEGISYSLTVQADISDRLYMHSGEIALPYRRTSKKGAVPLSLALSGQVYIAYQAALVISEKVETGLKLWLKGGETTIINGSLATSVELYQHCYDAGLPVHTVVTIAHHPHDP